MAEFIDRFCCDIITSDSFTSIAIVKNRLGIIVLTETNKKNVEPLNEGFYILRCNIIIGKDSSYNASNDAA